MERMIYYLLLVLSTGILYFSESVEAAAASELCQFQQGQTSVTAYCEQGCCFDQCCRSVDSTKELHLIILIVVCVVAALIIIVLIIICLCCVFGHRKRDRDQELEELDRGSTSEGQENEAYDNSASQGTSRPSPSRRGDKALLVTEGDSRRGSLQTRAKSSTSGNQRASSSVDRASEQPRRGSLAPAKKNPQRLTLRRQSEPVVRDKNDAVSSATTQAQRDPLGKGKASKVEEFRQQYSKSARFINVRHSDPSCLGTNDGTNDDIPLASILRPGVGRNGKRASVHFEKEK
ncbi:hypothetical protein ACOMHN_026126 [Nucella lapillus]